MKKQFVLFLCIITTIQLCAQCYEPHLKKADAAYARGDYNKAAAHYDSALCCPDARNHDNGSSARNGLSKCLPALTANGEKEVIVNVSSAAGKQSFSIKSLRLSTWSVGSDTHRGLSFTPNVEDGVLAVSWEENTSPRPREWLITIKGKGGVTPHCVDMRHEAVATIRIVQAKAGLTVNGQTQLEHSFTWEGGVARFDIGGIPARDGYTISGIEASWMSIQKESDHFFLIVTTNDSRTNERSKSITISCNNQSATIHVTQSDCSNKENLKAKARINLGGLQIGENVLIPFEYYSNMKSIKHGLLNSSGSVFCFDCDAMDNALFLHNISRRKRVWINSRCFVQISFTKTQDIVEGEDVEKCNIYNTVLFLYDDNTLKEIKRYELMNRDRFKDSWYYRFENGDFVIIYLITEQHENKNVSSWTKYGKRITIRGKTSKQSGITTKYLYCLDYYHSDGTLICTDSSYCRPDFFEDGFVTSLYMENKSGSRKKNELFFIKRNGLKIKLPSEIDDVLDISDGIVLFYNDSKHRYGYSNLDGDIIIPAQYRQARPFSEGLALVRKDEKYFIDKKGKRQKIRGDFYGSFSEGVAAAAFLERKLYYVNKNDEIQVGTDVNKAAFSNFFMTTDHNLYKEDDCFFSFHEGCAIIREIIGDKYGYSIINKKGERINNASYSYINRMPNGHFIVSAGGNWDVIDKTGVCVFHGTGSLNNIIHWPNKLTNISGRWSFDSTGSVFDGRLDNVIITAQVRDKLSIFSVNDIYGFFNDSLGIVTIQPQFNQAQPFSEELAAVMIGTKWGYIDKTGRMVIPTIFENAGQFSDGRVEVAIEGKKYYIDKKNHIIEK